MRAFQRTDFAGFSAVELLVSVAIVGVLASMAIPYYEDLSKKAKGSQASANLSTLYEFEMAFRSEFGSFTTRFDSLNFHLTGKLHYDVGFLIDFPPPADAPQGSAACIQACTNPFGNVNCPNVTWSCERSASYSLDATLLATASASTFTANAHAHWVNMARGESFFIDQNKRITHIPDGSAN